MRSVDFADLNFESVWGPLDFHLQIDTLSVIDILHLKKKLQCSKIKMKRQ